MTIKNPMTCPMCGGNGRVPMHDRNIDPICDRCEGRGEIAAHLQAGNALCSGVRMIGRPSDDFVYLRFDAHPEWEVRITSGGLDTYRLDRDGRHQDYLRWSDLLAIRETRHTA